MRWPWRRFEAMFQRHLLRKAKDQIERSRDLNLAAVNANSNYDGEESKEAKKNRIESIEESSREAIEYLYADVNKTKTKPVDDPFETDPLFRPVRRMREEANRGIAPQQAGLGRDLLDSML